jgi:hypothetical protein
VNTGLPRIDDADGGVPRLGHHLSASTGAWLNAPTAYSYQWQRCAADGAGCQPIPGASSQNHTLTAADFGATIRVDVTASNGGGSAHATSAPSAVVARRLVASPDRVDFGTVSPGGGGTPQAITVTNAGTGAVRITAVGLPAGPFTITGNCLGATLQAGGTCTVPVFFTAPATPGPRTYSETLTITYDQDPLPTTVSLTATVPAGAPVVAPGTIFGRVLDSGHGDAPVAGAWVYIRSFDGNKVSTGVYSAADGSYASPALAAGVYQLEVIPPPGLAGATAVVRVNGDSVRQDLRLHAPAPLSDGVTLNSAIGSQTSGVPTLFANTPFSLTIPFHIPTGEPNSTRVFAVLGGFGPDSGSAAGGSDIGGAAVFSVFYDSHGYPTRMSRILIGALDCGAPGGTNPCGRLAAAGVGAGARAASLMSAPLAHAAYCDVNGNYVPDRYADGQFHIIPNEHGGIDFVVPLADGSPERIGFLWQAQSPIPSPTGNPLRDTSIALGVGAVNGAINALVPEVGYYNSAVGALNGLAQLNDNPDPVAGGAQGLNAAASLSVSLLNAATHGSFYWVANILAGDVNAVLPGSPSTSPPAAPCGPTPGGGGPGGGGGGGGGGPGGGGGGGGFRGNIYIDPSGVVETRHGVPIAGATVSLTRSDTRSGRQRRLPAGSPTMAPANRRNPDHTGLQGNFGWDVLPGYYRVTAHRRGCRGQARTPVLAIPPPFTDLRLRLRCPRLHRASTRLRLRVRREGSGTTVLRATVAGHGARRRLTGTVTFRVGRTTLASAALDPRTRSAVLDVPRLKVHGRFSAAYSGNALFGPSRARH